MLVRVCCALSRIQSPRGLVLSWKWVGPFCRVSLRSPARLFRIWLARMPLCRSMRSDRTAKRALEGTQTHGQARAEVKKEEEGQRRQTKAMHETERRDTCVVVSARRFQTDFCIGNVGKETVIRPGAKTVTRQTRAEDMLQVRHVLEQGGRQLKERPCEKRETVCESLRTRDCEQRIGRASARAK